MRRRCGLVNGFPRRSGVRKGRAFLFALGLAISWIWPQPGDLGARLFEPQARVPGSGPAPSAPSDPGPGKGRLLVASRRLLDPNFAETVVLVLDSGAAGAIGVVVNRPSSLKLKSVLPDVKELTDRSETVFLGGPVERFQLLLLVRAPSPPEDSVRVFDDVFVTASLDALSRAAGARGDDVRFRLFAGYAGWAPGQLEAEIARGDWLVVPGDAERVFAAAPEEVWPELVEGGGSWVRLDRGPAPERTTRVAGPAVARLRSLAMRAAPVFPRCAVPGAGPSGGCADAGAS
jgi:putative transcriptional regulator